MRDGVEVERLTSNGTTPEQIEAAIVRLIEGAPAVGPPVPSTCASSGPEEVMTSMDLHGKKVIALGERDSVPGAAIAEVAMSRPAPRWSWSSTECFV